MLRAKPIRMHENSDYQAEPDIRLSRQGRSLSAASRAPADRRQYRHSYSDPESKTPGQETRSACAPKDMPRCLRIRKSRQPLPSILIDLGMRPRNLARHRCESPGPVGQREFATRRARFGSRIPINLAIQYRRSQGEDAKRMIALLASLQVREQCPSFGRRGLTPQRGKFLSCFETIHHRFLVRPPRASAPPACEALVARGMREFLPLLHSIPASGRFR